MGGTSDGDDVIILIMAAMKYELLSIYRHNNNDGNHAVL